MLRIIFLIDPICIYLKKKSGNWKAGFKIEYFETGSRIKNHGSAGHDFNFGIITILRSSLLYPSAKIMQNRRPLQ
jgi:hypothetical protein